MATITLHMLMIWEQDAEQLTMFFCLGLYLVFYRTKSQATVIISSAKSEFIATVLATKSAKHF